MCVLLRRRVNRQVMFLQVDPKVILPSYFDLVSPPNTKRSKIKAFFKVSLISVTMRVRTVLQI